MYISLLTSPLMTSLAEVPSLTFVRYFNTMLLFWFCCLTYIYNYLMCVYTCVCGCVKLCTGYIISIDNVNGPRGHTVLLTLMRYSLLDLYYCLYANVCVSVLNKLLALGLTTYVLLMVALGGLVARYFFISLLDISWVFVLHNIE